MYEIDYSLAWKFENVKLSGNDVICLKYEYVLFLLFCSDYARFINEMQAVMMQFRLIVRLIK